MQKKINLDYIRNFFVNIDQIKKPVPFVEIQPRIKSETENKIGIIFLNGLNGTKTMINYFNYPVFEDKWLFTFDNRAQGENQNFASKNYHKYVKDAYLSIEYLIKENQQIETWYLLGESWGGAIIIHLVKKKLNKKIKGVFFWNMPCKIVNVDPRSKKAAFINNIKVVTTFLFSIPLKTDNPVNPKLTNNKILLKVIEMLSTKKVNVGTILACWRSFKPAWNYLIKNHQKINFRYIQSGLDVLRDDSKISKISNITNKVILFDKGTHILSFDKDMDHSLFIQLSDFINENH